MLSIIIPSYKDPLLHRTIDSLLENSELGDKLEVVVCLDGYWPTTPIKEDKRIKIVHLGKNRGMRGAINAGVAVAKGEWLMRMDEHQIVDKGYDVKLIETCQPNWIVTPRRYYLDTEKWEIMNKPFEDHAKLVIQGGVKFAGQRWESRNKETEGEMLSETHAMQGSCWFMSHKWWKDVIKELDTELYGPLIQDSHEMVFKTWKAGGKLMLNRNTWHAHKHRSFRRTHNNGTKENPANCEYGYANMIKIWGKYYEELRKEWGY